MYEVENKYRVVDAAALERQFAERGVTFAAVQMQVDAYYAHPARDFRTTDEALRIRRVGDENCVTYKGPKIDTQTKTRRELELPLESGAAGASRFAELLTALSFTLVAEVHKQRRQGTLAWQGRQVVVAWDEVAEVGTFVELELVVAQEELPAAQAALLALASSLGLTELERRSYLRMVLERAGR